MRAATSEAFPDGDESPAVGTTRDRQLRLVFTDDEVSYGLPGGATPRSDLAGATAAAVVGSLADYALGLRVGDPCFCCGSPLGAFACPEEETDGRGRDLECVECGASIAGPR